MKWVILAVAVLSAIAGLIATRYWWKASKVFVMPMWEQNGRIEPVIPELAASSWTVAFIQTFQKAGRLNKIAAGWTAAAVILGGMAAVLSAWSSN